MRAPALPATALALLLAACAGGPLPQGLQSAPAPAPARAAAPAPAPAASSGGWDHEWARGAVFYEVFVRSFKDSNGDGKGDLQGLLAKLDYLNDGNPHSFGDLGVDALWLTPLFRSPNDYEHVNPDYGTDGDLAQLLAAAHKRGVKVIVAGHPLAVLVGEKGGGAELPMSFDFPLAEAIVQGAKTGQAGGIAAKLDEIARLSPKGAIDSPFLTNHDRIRVATQLGGDLGKEKSAAAVLLTLPGSPFLYYGEELGLENGPGTADEQKRTPMPWDATETGGFTTGKPWVGFAPGKERTNVATETSDPNSLLSHYRFLIRARHNSEALRKGSLTLLTPATATTPLLAFLRVTSGETVLVLHNLGDTPVEAGPYNVPGTPDPYFVSPGIPPPAGGSGAWKMKLPPHGSGVWRMRVR